MEVFKHTNINEYVSAIVIGAIKFLGALLYIPLVKYVSRRMLICGSSFAMGISMSILGLAMYSHETGLYSYLDGLFWLPLLCVTIYMLADPIGVGSVPFLYLGEFFPAEMRSVLSGLTISLSNLELFIVVKTFPNLTHMMGDSGTFWLYAGFCFVLILYTLVWIPETKGRTLQDIEKYFNHKENLHVTPLPTPAGTPAALKKNMYPHASIQFTLWISKNTEKSADSKQKPAKFVNKQFKTKFSRQKNVNKEFKTNFPAEKNVNKSRKSQQKNVNQSEKSNSGRENPVISA